MMLRIVKALVLTCFFFRDLFGDIAQNEALPPTKWHLVSLGYLAISPNRPNTPREIHTVVTLPRYIPSAGPSIETPTHNWERVDTCIPTLNWLCVVRDGWLTSVNRLQISCNEDSVSEAENGCDEVSMMQIVVDSNI
ncbi:hypothetical protein HJC23_014105 [Cyclotella cryptica]|uniref:Uncharacterized protein n=1 Tax=Cyclotella cryptica TaxID=29204 RepID=A0ABD3QTS8_9STRA